MWRSPSSSWCVFDGFSSSCQLLVFIFAILSPLMNCNIEIRVQRHQDLTTVSSTNFYQKNNNVRQDLTTVSSTDSYQKNNDVRQNHTYLTLSVSDTKSHVYNQDSSDVTFVGLAHRSKRGYYFPIAHYTVKHHRPGGYGYDKKPEVWEYHGVYNYGFRSKKKKFGATKGALLALAGVPLLMAPLLSLLFIPTLTIPAVTVTAGRRKRNVQETRLAKESEIQAIADFLKKVHHRDAQQETIMAKYLQCNGMLSGHDHCLERLACEFSDPLNIAAPELERTVCSM
ncbi:uncharacterized protein LOC143234429 isoform X2 [Tachypleus tridentatus]|uniref:uncharacterized protein LOC143234429 isoform X2 n=1 Tax=Tachypleus tridentatus TaxID=6853 RepID=UPI003FD5A901